MVSFFLPKKKCSQCCSFQAISILHSLWAKLKLFIWMNIRLIYGILACVFFYSEDRFYWIVCLYFITTVWYWPITYISIIFFLTFVFLYSLYTLQGITDVLGSNILVINSCKVMSLCDSFTQHFYSPFQVYLIIVRDSFFLVLSLAWSCLYRFRFLNLYISAHFLF